jgi:protein-disulfide isomerase
MDKLTKKELKELRKAERIEEEGKEARKKKLKNYGFWGLFAVLLLLCLGVLYYIVRPTSAPVSEIVSKEATASLPPLTAQDYRSGPEAAEVTLIEYGDFQCPACGHYFTMVNKLKGEYKDSLRFVFRNFPLSQIHKNAQLAAQAAFAAGKQGKFWEMHDLLYTNQTTWSESDNAETLFTQYAIEQLNLQPVQFTVDMNSSEAAELILQQAQGGQKAGVQGTPTFYLNGKLLINPTTYEDFKGAIEQELK